MLFDEGVIFQIHGMSNGDTNNNPATSDSPCRVLG